MTPLDICVSHRGASKKKNDCQTHLQNWWFNWHWQVWQLSLTCFVSYPWIFLLTGVVIFLCQAVISVTVFPAFVLSKSKRPWSSAAMRVAIQHSGWCQCEPLTSQRTTEGWRFLSVAVAWILRLLCLCRAKVQIRRVVLQSLMMRRTSSTRSATSRSAISCAFPFATGWKFFLAIQCKKHNCSPPTTRTSELQVKCCWQICCVVFLLWLLNRCKNQALLCMLCSLIGTFSRMWRKSSESIVDACAGRGVPVHEEQEFEWDAVLPRWKKPL